MRMLFRSPVSASLIALVISVAVIAGGCAKGPFAPSKSSTNSRQQAPKIDPREVQHAIMNFAERYLAAMAEIYGRAQRDGRTPDARITAQRLKLVAAIGGMGN